MQYHQIGLIFPDREKGYVCDHCGSYVKLYKRSFNSNMGICLLALYKHKVNGFVKVEDFLLEHGYKRCGDFSYLIHYNMLEKMKGKREDGSSKNGFYRLTSMGVMFCEGKTKVKEHFLICNNKLEGFAGREIDIHESLGNKFSFDKLMAQ